MLIVKIERLIHKIVGKQSGLMTQFGKQILGKVDYLLIYGLSNEQHNV